MDSITRTHIHDILFSPKQWKMKLKQSDIVWTTVNYVNLYERDSPVSKARTTMLPVMEPSVSVGVGVIPRLSSAVSSGSNTKLASVSDEAMPKLMTESIGRSGSSTRTLVAGRRPRFVTFTCK